MGTEVLRPHDVLNNRIGDLSASIQRRICRSVVVGPGRKQIGSKKGTKPNKKKISFSPEKDATKRERNGSAFEARKKDEDAATSGGLLVGKVTLLRRGESLDSIASKLNVALVADPKTPEPRPVDDLAIRTPEKLQKMPDSFPKQIRLFSSALPDVYAGSAFYSSPSPRSLPLPSFFNKKTTHEIKPCADSATEDLRRLLRLD